MKHSLNSISEDNEKKKLLYSIQELTSPTVVFIHVNSLKKEQELLQWFRSKVSEHFHFVLDLSSEHVDSLYTRILEFGKENKGKIQPLDIVHIIGLENSIMRYEHGQKIMMPLLANMNYERELFFNRLPCSTVLWADSSFFTELNRLAPDFTHWVTRWFEFNSEEEEPNSVIPAPKPTSLGKISEREDYIKHLEEQYNSLSLNTEDTERLILNKIDLLEAIGDEFSKQSSFQLSIKYMNQALTQAIKIPNLFIQAKIHFKLGTSYLSVREFKLSYHHYKLCLDLSEENNFGAVYHQIGRVYEEKRNWKLALENYQQAIQWNEKTGNEYQLGSTYHQIGRVYEEQNEWKRALEYIELSIENFQKYDHPSLDIALNSKNRILEHL